ncbi:hypothetical protein [Cognatiluteimonas telluris]|uniref:hypothetical protein n=1 Tax=Cognatiluteimonas telluris TaxID=1104775 RepID=UPI00140C9524|nr:hypothetical protein [Lysobacter telluris]
MSVATLPSLTPVFATAAIGWLYYRRIRRQFGRQRWQPTRTWLRIALLALLVVAIVVAGAMTAHGTLAVAAGLVVGALLGAVGLRHTRIEFGGDQHWYTPNPWIGGALSLLLVARLAWRWQRGAFTASAAVTTQQGGALTLAFASTLVAFYLVNAAGLAWRMRIAA